MKYLIGITMGMFLVFTSVQAEMKNEETKRIKRMDVPVSIVKYCAGNKNFHNCIERKMHEKNLL